MPLKASLGQKECDKSQIFNTINQPLYDWANPHINLFVGYVAEEKFDWIHFFLNSHLLFANLFLIDLQEIACILFSCGSYICD